MDFLIYVKIITIMAGAFCGEVTNTQLKSEFCKEEVVECVLDGESLEFCTNDFHSYYWREQGGIMQQGDMVDTPDGIGKFFKIKDKDQSIALIRLKKPTDKPIWYPIALDPRVGIVHMIPIDEVLLKDVTIVTSHEENLQNNEEETLQK